MLSQTLTLEISISLMSESVLTKMDGPKNRMVQRVYHAVTVRLSRNLKKK